MALRTGIPHAVVAQSSGELYVDTKEVMVGIVLGCRCHLDLDYVAELATVKVVRYVTDGANQTISD